MKLPARSSTHTDTHTTHRHTQTRRHTHTFTNASIRTLGESGALGWVHVSSSASGGVGDFLAVDVNAPMLVNFRVVLVSGKFVAVTSWHEFLRVGAFLRNGSRLADMTFGRV